METFEWDGVKYSFDANKCYDGTNFIRLPDGTLLKVHGWFETYPPIPAGLSKVDVVSASPIGLMAENPDPQDRR